MQTRRSRVLVVLVVLLALLLVVAMVGYFVRGLLQPKDDLNGATVINDQMPTVSTPAQMTARLNQSPSRWSATTYPAAQLPGPLPSAVTLDLSDHQTRRAAITNATDADSVRRNGTLLMVWTGYVPGAQDLVIANPAIFTDVNAEKSKQVYRLGTWVAYYAPPAAGAGTNRTEEVEKYLKVVSDCPFDTKPCTS